MAATTQIQPPGLKSSASQQREAPFFGAAPAKTPFFQPATPPKHQQGEEEGALQREATGAGAPEVTPGVEQQLSQSKGGGAPMPSRHNEEMSRAFGKDLSSVRIHTDARAADMSNQLQAKAFTHGKDIYFGANQHADTKAGKHLLAHELTHVVQQAPAQTISRVPLPYVYSKVERKKKKDILGDGTAANTGITLNEFKSYTMRQADWFAHPSLAKADRDALWAIIAKINLGPHIQSGAGDLKLKDLIPLPAADWAALATFGHGCHQDDTVIILNTTPPMARRIALGNRMQQMEALITGKVIKRTVSEDQLADVEANALLWTRITDYWNLFHPHLQRVYQPGPGARGLEFQKIINMFTAKAPVDFLALQGRIRNLHRFGIPALNKLKSNFTDLSHTLPLHLIIQTGNDAGAFQDAAPKFEDVINTSPNLVLMLEGRDSLAQIQTEIPILAQRYGKKDAKGNFSIAQVIVAGHGSPESVQLAGTSAPGVVKGRVEYTTESLDISNAAAKAKTQAFLDVLIQNLDPATAKIVYAGCLVGAHPVPLGTPAAGVQTHIAAHPNLGEFTQQRGAAAGKPVKVEAARASVALSETSLMDPVTKDLHITYPFDPQAFGTAAAYLAAGHEPEGTMRAAVEVAATNPVAAANLLRARLGFGVISDPWWDQCVIALVKAALDGVPLGGPVSLTRLLELSDVADLPFLGGFGTDFGISAAHFVNRVNPLISAPLIYREALNVPLMLAPGTIDHRLGRFFMEQGWYSLDAGREAPFIAFLNATPADFMRQMEIHLDRAAIGKYDATLFAPVAVHTPGRIKLALAWLHQDDTNALVRTFFDTEITDTPAGPVLSAAVTAQLAGRGPDEILDPLGRLVPRPPGDNRPLANAQIPGRKRNTLLIELKAYIATVTAVKKLPVFRGPGPKHTGIGWVNPGATLQVAGFTGGWAAFDFKGRLGYVDKTQITPP